MHVGCGLIDMLPLRLSELAETLTAVMWGGAETFGSVLDCGPL